MRNKMPRYPKMIYSLFNVHWVPNESEEKKLKIFILIEKILLGGVGVCFLGFVVFLLITAGMN